MKSTGPIRQCIGCGQRDAQEQLLRVTLEASGTLRFGAGNGRGAYFHKKRDCVRAFATARSGFVRSWRLGVSRDMRARYAEWIEHHVV